MRLATLALLLATALAPDAAGAQAARSPDNIREFFGYLDQCVRVPPGSAGSEITLRFSVTHIGALRGQPMITYSKLVGDEAAQRAFVAAALKALANCTPVPVTEGFGRVIGEKMLTWRIRAAPAPRPDRPT